MNNKIFTLLVALMFLQTSCSKKADSVNIEIKTEKLYKVSLGVSTFTSEITELSSTATVSSGNTNTTVTNAIGDQIKRLQYLIYNSSGVLVKNATEENSLSTFGAINEQLPAGDYKIHIIGSTEIFNILGSESNTQLFVSPSIYNIGDLFTKSMDIKVVDQPQTQSVVLDRTVGKIEVQIADAIPAGVTKITVSSTSGSWIYLNYSGEASTEVKTVDVILATTDIDKTNFLLNSYIIPLKIGSITSDVSIRAYNSSGGLIADKIVKDVKVEKNKKTILTGKLFTAAAVNTGFTVGVNGDWSLSTNAVSF